MVNDQMIQRINELANKMKTVGLTDNEKKEQSELRQKYVNAFKTSLRAQLESIEFVEDEKDTKKRK